MDNGSWIGLQCLKAPEWNRLTQLVNGTTGLRALAKVQATPPNNLSLELLLLSRLTSALYWRAHSSSYIWSGLVESGSNSASEMFDLEVPLSEGNLPSLFPNSWGGLPSLTYWSISLWAKGSDLVLLSRASHLFSFTFHQILQTGTTRFWGSGNLQWKSSENSVLWWIHCLESGRLLGHNPQEKCNCHFSGNSEFIPKVVTALTWSGRTEHIQ